jgi:hypothetical protein
MSETMRIKTFILCAAGLLALAACSNVKKQLGLEPSPPDEFSVVQRAPLAMPPDYTLRPPRPGAQRPQEQAPTQQAQDAVFGNNDNQTPVPPANSDQALLQQAGAQNVQPGIRQEIDTESVTQAPKRTTALQKMHLQSPTDPVGNVINPQSEAQRLNEDPQTGQPLPQAQTAAPPQPPQQQ